jgi:nitrite reductase/ring-hydroxylating ferredoxin subunit
MMGGFSMLPEPLVLGTEAEMPGHNMMKEFRLGDKTVYVANVEGVIFAMDKDCVGEEGPFVPEGQEPCKSITSSAGWRWTPNDGTENSAGIAVYPVKVENNQVVIQIHMAEPAVPEEDSGRGAA